VAEDGIVYNVSVSPDGSLVAVFAPFEGVPTTNAPPDQASGADLRHGAVVWSYPIGRSAWAANACRIVGRSLSHEEWNTFLPELAYQPSCH